MKSKISRQRCSPQRRRVFTEILWTISALNISEKSHKRPMRIRGVFRTLSDIQDWVFCESSERLKVMNYFRKTLHLRCLTGFLIRLRKSSFSQGFCETCKFCSCFFLQAKLFSCQPKCCLLHIKTWSYRGMLYFVHLCPYLGLGLIIWSIFHYFFHFHCN